MRLCHQPNAAIDLHLPAIDILSLFFPFAASVSRSCFQISTSAISQQINTQLLKKKWRRWSLQRILSSYQLETLSNVSLVLPLITLSQSTWSHFVAIFLHTNTGPGFFFSGGVINNRFRRFFVPWYSVSQSPESHFLYWNGRLYSMNR